jgi:hypothetical protein
LRGNKIILVSTRRFPNIAKPIDAFGVAHDKFLNLGDCELIFENTLEEKRKRNKVVIRKRSPGNNFDQMFKFVSTIVFPSGARF